MAKVVCGRLFSLSSEYGVSASTLCQHSARPNDDEKLLSGGDHGATLFVVLQKAQIATFLSAGKDGVEDKETNISRTIVVSGVTFHHLGKSVATLCGAVEKLLDVESTLLHHPTAMVTD